MVPRHTRRAASVAGLALLLAGAAACGSSSSGGSSPSGSSSVGTQPSGAPTAQLDQSVAALVPAALKSAGSIKVATDASYAPNEFFAKDNKTIQGMDADLGKAIGTEMGVPWQFNELEFDSILPALGTRFDVGMSSFTDTKEREKTVSMVDYYSAGTAFMVPSNSSLKPSSVADLCGKNVAVEKGTTQLDDVTAQKKKCSLNILAFPDQNAANQALASGRADVVLADSPVNAYAAKQSSGQFKIVGQVYGTAPYGIAIPMGSKYTGLDKAVQAALQDLQKRGVYQSILSKWGIQSGGVTSFPIDGATS